MLVKAAAAALLLAFTAGGAAAREIDWAAAEGRPLTLFYPGVASWEFVTGDDHRLGSHEIRLGRKDCRHCHLGKAGELDLQADEMASGALRMKRSRNPFEPEPTPGKKGSLSATVKAAYDAESLYIRVEWPSAAAAWAAKGPDATPDRVSLQLNKGEPQFRKYGCFIACHNDLSTMPGSPSREAVRADRYYSGLGRDDVRLYAAYAKGSWSDRKVERSRASTGTIDLWSAELASGSAKALDGWIFEDRRWQEAMPLEAAASWASGRYAVVFKRRLAGPSQADLDAAPGGSFSVAVAVHDAGASGRRHYVSFPFTIGLGAEADLKALKLK